MYTRWRILGEFTTTSPLHIGSGDVTCHDRIMGKGKDKGKEGELVDIQAVVKDCQGRPCIPGTAMKGVLRAWAEQRLPGEESRIDRIFGCRKIGSADVEAGWAEFCTATLKDPSHESMERFAEFVPYWQARSLTGILSHVCIDRHTGAARHNKLFYEEFVPEGITFDVEIAATRLTEEEIGLLLAILSEGAVHATHSYRFGANGSDGWGRMSWQLDRVMTCEDPDPATATRIVGFECCQNGISITPANVAPQATNYVSAELLLNFDGPFLVNDASRANRPEENDSDENSAPDFLPLKRADGGNWLPASSFRGALRERAEFLLCSLNPDATGDPNDKKVGNGPIERIFGKTSQASALTIDEFTEEGRSSHRRQDFVAIDRLTGGAADGAKFDALFADRPKFRTTMQLDLNGLQPADVALLGLALRDLCGGSVPLGWGGSKGYGNYTGRLNLLGQAGVPSDWNVPETLYSGRADEAAQTWLKQQLGSLVNADQAKGQDIAASPSAAPDSTLQGTLSVIKTKRRFDYSLSYERGGKPKTIKVTDGSQIQPDLVNTPVTNLEVDFEFQGGKPARVRRRGEVWPTAATIEASPPVTDQATGAFANPYFFIRLEDRKDFKGELTDNNPAGHKRYLPDRYSGTIRVKLTVETPLLICDDETADEEEGHKTYEVRCQDGKPLLASSSVRGMLRSAYEAITNSRFGVFPFKPQRKEINKRGHARRFGFRMNAGDGLSLVPIRIENGQCYLMLGRNPRLPEFDQKRNRWVVPGVLHAAWVPQYDADVSGISASAITVDGNPPRHGQEAWCWLEKMQHTSPTFTFWRVREAAASEEQLSPGEPRSTIASGKYSSLKEFSKASGIFVFSNQNIRNKHDERFFFAVSEIKAKLDDAVLSEYLTLIEDCQDIHAAELAERQENSQSPTHYTASIPPSRDNPGRAEIAAMSRHTYEQSATATDEAMLCYGRVKEINGTYVVERLIPVMISRRLYEESPLDCLPKSLRPAQSLSELSPADLTFRISRSGNFVFSVCW
ncbi:MAG: RAMP superfamily CRISPR-associated protein, partial [Candidatus Paceibacterota bacterium]